MVNDLRSGKLRLLLRDSSMELGIDVGDIDQFFQVGCPAPYPALMQSAGAGMGIIRTGPSVKYIFTRAPAEGPTATNR